MGNLTQNEARSVGYLTFVVKVLSVVGKKSILELFESVFRPCNRLKLFLISNGFFYCCCSI